MEHILEEVFALPANSTLHKILIYNGYVEPLDFITESYEALEELDLWELWGQASSVEGWAYSGTYNVQYSRKWGNIIDRPVHVWTEAVQPVQPGRETRVQYKRYRGDEKREKGIRQSSS